LLTHLLNAFVESLLENIVSIGMMGWKKNGQQNKTRQEKKEEKMGKKEEEETGRNKAKQAKGVMGLML
jgi:hypothetical protein